MIIDDEKEKYMEVNPSYYYKVLGINYLIIRENKIIDTNVKTFKDINKEDVMQK